MALIQHVFRRGSVYWWRRRFTLGTTRDQGVRLELSLHTKEARTARRIAPEMTLASDRLQDALRAGLVSIGEAKKILHQVAEKGGSYFDPFLPDEGNARIGVPAKQAEPVKFEDMQASLITTRQDPLRRECDNGVFSSLVKNTPLPVQADSDVPFSTHKTFGMASHVMLMGPNPELAVARDTPVERCGAGGGRVVKRQNSVPGLVEIVTRAAAEKIKTGEWRKGMEKQHVSVARLLVKLVGHDQPGEMRQSDIATFRSTLLQLPKNHGKSPKDRGTPIAELVARAEGLPPEEVGLSPSTLNRYMTQLNNIVNICRHAGYPFANYEGVSGLRVRRKGSVRNQRGRFRTDELSTLFSLPIWCGSSGPARRLDAGATVFHDANYWVPLMSIYIGARREENCGLLLSEIEDDIAFPSIRFEDNFLRKLKNEQSNRRIPIHRELIRLGFLDYVRLLRQERHTLLFPELRAASAETPMGNVFETSWQKMRSAALPDAKKEGKVFHSLRHWCNNEMKQAGVPSEIRKDILGHSNDGINEGRYSDAARLPVMAKALDGLPCPTAGLLPHPIRLIEQVIRHARRPTKIRKSIA